MMKFKIDENLPVEVAEVLRQAGYEAATVHDQNLAGEIDRTIALVCQSEQRALITLDTDFADIRTYPPGQYAGLVVLRLKQQDKRSVLTVIARLVKALTTEELERYLWIVDEKRIRVRG
jgi:predicted nuclease of predicted toxin-antitoxin system